MLSDIGVHEEQKPKPLGKRHGVKMKGSIVYKIIMGGGSNRGQTSFISRFTTGEWTRTIPTIGSEYGNLISLSSLVSSKILDYDGHELAISFINATIYPLFITSQDHSVPCCSHPTVLRRFRLCYTTLASLLEVI